jgi:hypothetical protein
MEFLPAPALMLHHALKVRAVSPNAPGYLKGY